jgi:prevent-host-death family protein
MAAEPKDAGTVGVRELRQNLSVYLRRVVAGETLRVTEHGRPVAQLAPLPRESLSVLDQLIAQGLATPARGDLMDFLEREGLPKAGPSGISLSEALEAQRAERLY